MPYEPRDGAGSLFPNSKTKDTQPDWTGDFMIHGRQFEIAGWTKKSKRGDFLSLAIKPRPAEDEGE